MRRTIAQGFLTCFVLVLVSPCLAGLYVEPDCDGAGIKGTLTANDVTVYFTSCEIANGGLHTKLSRASGGISELTYDAVGDVVTIKLGDVEITAETTLEQFEVAWDALMSNEGQLAITLFNRLRDLGYSTTYAAMRGIGAASEGLARLGTPIGEVPLACENCMDTPDCNGCCGRGCSECHGICTRSCEEHDNCIGQRTAMGRPQLMAEWDCSGLLILV